MLSSRIWLKKYRSTNRTSVKMDKFNWAKLLLTRKGRKVIIRAAFQSKEGQQQYAVELRGAINFVETKLADVPRADLAA
jgi:hypothetical protein